MNTVQRYTGKGNNLSSTPQTAPIAAKTPFTADNRPEFSAVGAEQIQVNKTVYEAQTKLLELVDDFLLIGKGVTPIEAINELLYEWLATPHAVITDQHNNAKLWIALELVSFLSKLKDYSDTTNYLVDEAHKEEVLYGNK